MAKIGIKIEVSPASGTGSSKTVEVDPSGASVGEVLQSAGLSADKMNLSVNGEPATLDTHVGEGASVKLTEKAAGS